MKKLHLALLGWFVLVGGATGQESAKPLPAKVDRAKPLPAKVESAKSLPAKVDLRPTFKKFGLSAMDQGAKRGTCALFAITATAELELARASASRAGRMSAEFLIWAKREASGLDTPESAYFYEAARALNTYGICRANLMPYQATTDSSRQPSEAARADARARSKRWHINWIRRWDTNRQLGTGEMASLKRSLADGRPVAIALRWPKKYPKSHIMQALDLNDVKVGHSVVFVGFEDDARAAGGGYFRFLNSAGPRWGDNGYACIAYAYVRDHAIEALSLRYDSTPVPPPTERFEAEKLDILGSLTCPAAPEDMANWGGRFWGEGKQLLCKALGAGDWIELAFHVSRAGNYYVELHATLAHDYGKIQTSIDGQNVGPVLDLYSSCVQPIGPMRLGQLTLEAGQHRLRFTVEGKHQRSKGHFFGIDALDLRASK
jgi:hypothetical protein